MKVRFLRDYHGPETDEHRYLEGEEVILSDLFGVDFVRRGIVDSLESIEAVQKIEAEPKKPVVKKHVKK